MMEAGLIQELQDFHERYNKDRMKKNELPDYTKGIFQSIGFKEFHKYLILPEEKKDTVLGQKLLNGAIETLKQVTKRYARRQNKWVKNRLLRRLDRQVPPVYSLDSTNVEQWESEVYGKAVEIVLAVMVGEKPHNPPMSIDINNAKYTDSSNVKRHFCEVCQKTLFTDEQWIAHLHGGRHTRTVKKLKKLEKQDGCGEDDPAKRSTKTGNKHEHTENVLAMSLLVLMINYMLLFPRNIVFFLFLGTAVLIPLCNVEMHVEGMKMWRQRKKSKKQAYDLVYIEMFQIFYIMKSDEIRG
ncbi:PREDICTED: tRNA dimethylallyltransferase, mitochondrial-like [Ceratosolen solmsi marchali]|uniref:tRNA dimethylallyltransferase, mitochondrial-like n=1 Tax=Ceratosolen solmsi marchali TaxID=326594 RepID=A0AAJ6VL28_9HYME|nr:PREDICTED: tRNA dimethylallyltransferase, mitochondrial-like [Ceratosolen solmsi marchali]